MGKLYKPKATGSTYKHDPMKPATLPVPKQMLLSKFSVIKKDEKTGRPEVRSYMQERELKVLFFLLHAVFDELEPNVEHEIDILKANKALKEEYGINERSTTWLWESIQTIADVRLRWIEMDGDERWQNVGYILTAKTNQTAKDEGILRFEFCKNLLPVLKEQSKFSRLKLHFLMNLSSRHAILLYGILEGYANYTHTNTFTFELSLIREWLKIEPEQYNRYPDFRRYALEPAFKQINANPKGAGFSVDYTPIKRGRKVVALEVTINKTADRKELEERLRAKSKDKKEKPEAVTPEVLPSLKLNIEKLKNTALKKGFRVDIYALISEFEAEWREWLYSSGNSETAKSPESSFLGFLKKKGIKPTESEGVQAAKNILRA